MKIENKIRGDNNPFIGWIIPDKDKAILIDNSFFQRNHIELCNELGIDCNLSLDDYEEILIGKRKWIRLSGVYPTLCSVEMDTNDQRSIRSLRKFLDEMDFQKLIVTDYKNRNVLWKGFADKFKLRGFDAEQESLDHKLLTMLLLTENIIDVRYLIRSL